MKNGKRFLAMVLAVAMVVTSVFTGNVTTVEAAEPQPTELAKPVSSYKFDVSADDAQPSLGVGVVLKQSTNDTDNNNDLHEYTEDAVFVAGRSGKKGDYAVDAQGKHGIVLPDKQLGDNYSVSFWVKPTDLSKDKWATSLLFVGRAKPDEKWISICTNKDGNGGMTCWSFGTTPNPYGQKNITVKQNEWQMITAVQSGTDVKFYVNGEFKYERKDCKKAMEDDNQFIALGTNHWDGNYYGIYDDVYVYNQALSDNQVKALYMKDGGEISLSALNILGENASADFITTDLNLPDTYRGTTLAWESKDAAKIGDDGTVKVFDGSEVTLTAKAAFSDGSSWSQDYKVTLAKEVTISYVNKSTQTELKSKTVKYKKADNYTYALTDADKVWTDNDAAKTTYVFDGADADLTTDHATAKVTLSYKADAITEVTGTIPSITTRVGVYPELPKTVKAAFQSGAERDVEIDWSDVTVDKYAAAGTKTVSAGVGSKTVTVQLVTKDKDDYLIANYTFDEGVDGLQDKVTAKGAEAKGTAATTIEMKEGLQGNAVYLPGGAKGTAYIELPPDLLDKDGNGNARNITISLFTKTNITGNSFAMSLLAAGTDSTGTDYIGLINHKELRAEFKCDSGQYRADGKPVEQDKWHHFAIVVDSDSHTMKLYKDGAEEKSITNNGIDISKFTAPDLSNWLGHSAWPDDEYKGAIDEFKIYDVVLTEKEIKSICDDTLYTAQLEKAKDALKTLKTMDGEDADLDELTENLNLSPVGIGDSTTITWESTNPDVVNVSSNEEAIVIQPIDDDAPDVTEVTLTATIKIRDYQEVEITYTIKVPKGEGVSTKLLEKAIADAQKVLDNADRKIYTADSVAALEKAIADAQEIVDSVTAQTTVEEIEQATADMNKAAAETLKLKNLDEMQDYLAAWYPLDTDASDKSGNDADGTAATSITFSRENGATFNGGAALKNMITLPNDKLRITNQMTFSFSIKAAAIGNIFGLGSLFAEKGSDAKQFYLDSRMNAFVTDKGWASGGHKGPSVTFDLNKWHDVTAVLNGKTITLYVDGEKTNTVATDITMPEAWNAEGGTQFAYLGNCAYGNNGDADFKGSIKDVRIYNVVLADEQIEAITTYRDNLPMNYAKDELLKAMGARAQDDSYTMNVTQKSLTEGKMNLPATLYDGKATVTWTSDNAEVINAETKEVTLPELGEEAVSVKLTASITIGDKDPETIEFLCSVYTRNEALDNSEDMQALRALIAKADGYTRTDYTKASWTALQTALTGAVEQEANPTNETTLKAALTALQTADTGLVNISGLRNKIRNIRNGLLDLEEETYTTESWNGLSTKLAAADAVLAKDDASVQEIADAIAALPESAEKGLTKCGDKTALDKAIADAEGMAVYKDAYSNWSALETALETAKAEQEKRLASYDAAATALNSAIDALVIKDGHKLEGTVKDNLDKKLEEAKAENLTESNYTAASWKVYKDALDTFESVLGKKKATKEEAEAALQALETARTALVPTTAQKAGEEEKTKLQDAINGMNTAGDDYTAESWASYQNAKAALDKLKERLNAENHNVTKDEVTKAISAFNTAAGKLEPTEEQKLTEADKTALADSIKAAKALKLSNYTEESRKAYEDALKTLESLKNKKNVTKNEVKAAEAALAKAKADLVPVDAQKVDAEKKQEFKTAYEAETGKALKEADYTAESWVRYQAAMTAASEISERLSKDKNNVTKDEVDAVIKELKEASEALVATAPDVNKTALDAAIKSCASLKEADYTADTWATFKKALETANTVLKNDKATQKEVDEALAALNAAKVALKAAEKGTNDGGIKVTKIKVSATYTNVAAGKKTTVKKAVTPANATSQDVDWSVAEKDKKYASVNGKGVVTTKKAGGGRTITVIATAKDGSGVTGTIKIKIMKNAVTKVTLKAKTKKVKAGKKVTVKATVKTNGKNANKKLEWKTSNKKFATVNSKGVVTTKKAGKGKTVTITATATDGTGKKGTVKIKIVK